MQQFVESSKAKHNEKRPEGRCGTFKKAYGQVKTNKPVKDSRYFFPYTEPVDPWCKKCSKGKLTRRMWGTLLCTDKDCNHQEAE